MSIIIQNISAEFDPIGVQDYELRINHKVIARFSHNRSDGLVRCLELAAEAADNAMYERIMDILESK